MNSPRMQAGTTTPPSASFSHDDGSTTIDALIDRLVPAAITGDRAALQQLIGLIHPSVVRYCRARVNSQRYPTAEDIAQEVCLAVARALPAYKDRGLPFMAFVYRVASNKVIDARRVYSRDLAHPVDEVPDSEVSVDTPESDVLALSSCNEVSGMLDILSDKAREVILLRVFGGYSAEETAQSLGMTAGAVRVAQFRALAKLRKHIETSDPELSLAFSRYAASAAAQ